MKFSTLYLFFFLSFLVIIFSSSSGGRAFTAGDGNTGAPGESGTTCGSCHNDGNFGAVTTSIELKDPISGNAISEYVPGTTYELELTVQAGAGTPAGYGFQLTALNATNNNTGSWANPSTNVQISTASMIAGGREYIEHLSAGASNVFTADWTAPAVGSGPAVFYYAGNAVNGAAGTSGDNATNGNSFTLNEDTTVGIESISALLETNLYPNPANSLVSLSLNFEETTDFTIELMNAVGQQIESKNYSTKDLFETIDVQPLSSGVYYLKVQKEEQIKMMPLIVQ